MPVAAAVAAAVCHRCCENVTCAEDACLALGSLYHTTCFICCSCGRMLRGKAFYIINDKVYCEEDYTLCGFQRDAYRCDICDHIIKDAVLEAMGKHFHPGCFKCCVCDQWLDKLPFTLGKNNEIYCLNDYHRIHAPKCDGCGLSILPVPGSIETVKVVAMDKNFHVDCYHCETCEMQLTDEPEKRCYPLDNHLLCHNCHLQRIKSGQPAPTTAALPPTTASVAPTPPAHTSAEEDASTASATDRTAHDVTNHGKTYDDLKDGKFFKNKAENKNVVIAQVCNSELLPKQIIPLSLSEKNAATNRKRFDENSGVKNRVTFSDADSSHEVQDLGKTCVPEKQSSIWSMRGREQGSRAEAGGSAVNIRSTSILGRNRDGRVTNSFYSPAQRANSTSTPSTQTLTAVNNRLGLPTNNQQVIGNYKRLIGSNYCSTTTSDRVSVAASDLRPIGVPGLQNRPIREGDSSDGPIATSDCHDVIMALPNSPRNGAIGNRSKSTSYSTTSLGRRQMLETEIETSPSEVINRSAANVLKDVPLNRLMDDNTSAAQRWGAAAAVSQYSTSSLGRRKAAGVSSTALSTFYQPEKADAGCRVPESVGLKRTPNTIV